MTCPRQAYIPSGKIPYRIHVASRDLTDGPQSLAYKQTLGHCTQEVLVRSVNESLIICNPWRVSLVTSLISTKVLIVHINHRILSRKLKDDLRVAQSSIELNAIYELENTKRLLLTITGDPDMYRAMWHTHLVDMKPDRTVLSFWLPGCGEKVFIESLH